MDGYSHERGGSLVNDERLAPVYTAEEVAPPPPAAMNY